MGKQKQVMVTFGILMLLPLLCYFFIQLTPLDKRIHTPQGHFYIVTVVSLLALAVAVAIGVVAPRIRNIKVSLLSLSYISLAAMFILHGISTPGLLIHHTGISGSVAQLSVLFAATWLWLCSISADHKIVRWLSMKQTWLLPVWCVLLLGFGIYLWLYPDFVYYLHLKGGISKWITTAAVLSMNLWTIYRNMQTYLVSKFPLQLAIVYSTGWMFIAQIIMVTGEAWMASWWLYHFLLLASVIIMVSGIIREHLSTGSITTSIKLLFRANPEDWINTYISPSVRELVMATEAKDSYTAGHNYRVALYALKLGEELGLSSAQLRAIAQGGLVHDIGKLYLPDGILNKPGKLTDEERAIIESHPESGYDVCKRLGFMVEELAVIRWHHEKWNGSGYPDQLSGEDIPLVSRITAVADVYDALTSSRSYRKAMTHEEAMIILLKESGRHFDPRCIHAWERLVREQQDFFRATLLNSPHLKLEHKQTN